jgi:hypothetical protein
MHGDHLNNWHTGAYQPPDMPYNYKVINHTTPMTTDQITKSLRLLRDGFKYDFATFAYADERMVELLQQLASEFVDANIPVVEEDNRVDLAMMLMESLDIAAR